MPAGEAVVEAACSLSPSERLRAPARASSASAHVEPRVLEGHAPSPCTRGSSRTPVCPFSQVRVRREASVQFRGFPGKVDMWPWAPTKQQLVHSEQLGGCGLGHTGSRVRSFS